MQLILMLILAFLFLYPLPVFAYVGPGLGLGALGAILGILFSIFLAVLGIFWYPIKRFIKKLRNKNNQKNESR